ncbi:MAG: hypothetical protein PQJ50_09525 [Spirochaetales bacterium]|nr:hypothetical protein [Spirochaetales bacterium]
MKYLEKNTVVISPLTAAMNTPENRICCIDQKSYVERLLLNQGEMEHIPEMGTVAATALNFILSRSTSNVYVAGLDLCMSDISMHIRPHSFDPIILAGESRFRTGYGEYYSRAAAMTHSLTGRYRLTRAMNTYSSWFSGQNFGNRVFRINPTPVDLPFNDLSSLESLNEILNESVKKEIFFQPDRAYPEAEVRKERVRRLAESLQSELEEFISTGRSGRFLTEFASEVMPVSLAGLKEDSSKEDFLCRMDKLIDSTEGILNGQ